MTPFIPRAFHPGSEHFFLLSPRGTGKTSWCAHEYPDALRIDLLEPDILRQFSARPERLKELVADRTKKQIVVDEIQKLPQLLDVVHLLIEQKTGQQFILTGSSARKLRREGVNLLGGRAASHHLHPYLASELGSDFDLEKALHQGMLPVIWASVDPLKMLQAYNGLYLREEVQQEGLVRNMGSFARFMEAMSFAHGSVLNLSNVARECEVSRTTVEGYLTILEDLMLGFKLDVFSRKAKRKLAATPKFYFFDAGVFRANRPAGPLDSPAELSGAALEGLVAQHLRAWCDYTAGSHRLYYWQTRAQLEVDFVVYGESGFHAIEVKNTVKVRPEDLKGLRAFGEDYPQGKLYFLYRGKERLLIDGILCLPCADFLLALEPGVFPG